MTPACLLETRALTKIYGGAQPVTALADVSLTVRPGEFLSIIGPSGSGKSTLMNLLGLLDTPSSGALRYHGDDAARWSEKQRAQFRNREIGFVFQAHLLLPEFTALENVLMPRRIAGTCNGEALRAAHDLLGRIGLGDRLHHRPGALSGGQNQRVAIARALVNRPRIVFADEPTGALDTQTSQDVYRLMRAISHDDGVAFVIVTHEQALSQKTDRMITLRDGRVLSDVSHSPPAPEAA